MLALLVASSLASTARAQTPDKREAEALFVEGRKAIAAQDFVTARAKLEASQKLYGGSGTLINLAYCYERLGYLSLAHRTYVSALKLTEKLGQRDRAQSARDRLAELGKRIALVTFAAPAEAAVSIDGESVATNESVAIEPGKHLVRAKSPSGATWQGTLAAEAGTAFSFPVPIAASPAAATVPPRGASPSAPTGAVTDDTEEEKETQRAPFRITQRTVGVAAMGVGVVSLGASAFLGLKAKSTYDDANAQCNDQVCNAEGIKLTDSALSSAAWSTVFFGAGVVAAGTGAVLFFTAKSDAPRVTHAGPRLRVSTGARTMLLFEGSL